MGHHSLLDSRYANGVLVHLPSEPLAWMANLVKSLLMISGFLQKHHNYLLTLHVHKMHDLDDQAATFVVRILYMGPQNRSHQVISGHQSQNQFHASWFVRHQIFHFVIITTF